MSSTTPRNQTKKKSLFERFGITLSNIRSQFRRNKTVKVTAPRTAEEIQLEDNKTLQKAGPQKVKDAFNFDIKNLAVQGESSEEFIKKLQKDLFNINREIDGEKDRAKIKQLQLSRREIKRTIRDIEKLINQTKTVQSGERRSVAKLERTQRQIDAQMQAATRRLENALAEGQAYSARTRKKGTGGMKKRRKYKKRY